MSEVTRVFKVAEGINEQVKEAIKSWDLDHPVINHFQLFPEASVGFLDIDETDDCQAFTGILAHSFKNALLTVTLVSVKTEDDDDGNEEPCEFVCVTWDDDVLELLRIMSLARSLGVSVFPEPNDGFHLPAFHHNLVKEITRLRVDYRKQLAIQKRRVV